MLSAIDGLISSAKAAVRAGEARACDATAGLVEEAPEGWDAEEDGEWKGTYNSASDRYPVSANGCGPLTPALDSALVTSDEVVFTASAEYAVDMLDALISEVVGFGVDGEALAEEVLGGMEDHLDASASAPDDWDAEEDGEWEAPVVKGQDLTSLLANVLTSGGPQSSGLHDAYSFSSSPRLVRHRENGASRGREAAHYACTDFARTSGEPSAAIVAYLFASGVPKGGAGGGEVTLPAAKLSVAPKVGRLLLVETSLPDGSCDPAAALGVTSPRSGSSLMLQKTYYADRTHVREKHDREGPQRGTPTVVCDGGKVYGCRRYEHVPALKGDAVLPMRGEKAKRLCLPAHADGACVDPDYTPPPPPPPKKKKSKAASSSPQAETAAPVVEKVVERAIPGAPPRAPPPM